MKDEEQEKFYLPLVEQKLPDFELDAFYENQIKKVKLSDYQGKWLALVFYPADFTFVCPTELEELAELYPEFQKLGAEVLSISRDTAFVHKAWHDNSPAVRKVKFPMLSDPTGEFSRALRVYDPKAGLSLRGSFIVDPDGIIKTMEVNAEKIGRSAKELLRKLKAAIFVRQNKGDVCPASWEPGKKTLKPGIDLIGKI